MICPKCFEKLIRQEHSFVCPNHHCYDIAKQGYVNLMFEGGQHGDTKDMVLARHRFLEKGYYDVLKHELVDIIKKAKPNDLIDLGCGEGTYTRSMSQYAAQCFGIDISKEALKLASRLDKHTQYIVASIFHLPFLDGQADCMTNVFAPAPIEECVRVLKEGGIYVRVAPHVRHLFELKEELYGQQVYENEIKMIEHDQLELVHHYKIEDCIHLDHNEDISALFGMTPYFWKSSKEVSEKVKYLEKLTCTIAFDIQIYRRKGSLLNEGMI